MTIDRNKMIENLIWISTVAFIVSAIMRPFSDVFLVALFVITPFILILHLWQHNGRLDYHFDYFIAIESIFLIWCALSILWAYDQYVAGISFLKFLTKIFGCFVIYLHYREKRDIESLLTAVMYSGYLVAILCVVILGFGGIIDLTEKGHRIGTSTFLNGNTVGILVARTLLINAFFALIHKEKVWTMLLFGLPSVLLIAMSGSRKAMILFVLGFLALVFVKYCSREKLFLEKFLRIIIGLFVVGMCLYFVLQLPVFEMVSKRFTMMIDAYTDTSHGSFGDIRWQLVMIGWNVFLDNFLFGVGFDNAGVVVGNYFGISYFYTHNNYIELLASLGITGFSLYYLLHFWLLKNYIRFLEHRDELYVFCFLMLVLSIIVEWGYVAYVDIETYMWLVIFSIEIMVVQRRIFDIRNL